MLLIDYNTFAMQCNNNSRDLFKQLRYYRQHPNRPIYAYRNKNKGLLTYEYKLIINNTSKLLLAGELRRKINFYLGRYKLC